MASRIQKEAERWRAALIQVLIDERKKRRIRQKRLAARLKITQAFISRVEAGKRPIDIGDFVIWAHAIGFDPVPAIRQVIEKATRRRGRFDTCGEKPLSANAPPSAGF
jgi:transcriptional regulator with XRE-family HTH domain